MGRKARHLRLAELRKHLLAPLLQQIVDQEQLPSGLAQLQNEFVDVTPAPVLTRLERADDRMVRGVIVLAGVSILRIVAAAYVTAGPAQAQMHPLITERQALLAAIRLGLGRLDGAQVLAACAHGVLAGFPATYHRICRGTIRR